MSFWDKFARFLRKKSKKMTVTRFSAEWCHEIQTEMMRMFNEEA